MSYPNDDGYQFGFTLEELSNEAERSNFHPGVASALRWLADDGHLPENLRTINNWFGYVGISAAMNAPVSPQTTIAIHKLVEAKDAAIRGYIECHPGPYAVTAA